MTNTEMVTASIRVIDFDDIQLLRYWRNLDHVREKMILRNSIHRDGQRRWFSTLNNETFKYFIFSLGMDDIGCANLTKINMEEKTFEAGIFCGNISYLNHWINIWACIKIYDHAFFNLKLEESCAFILKDNKSALSLNRSLGYTLIKYTNENVGHFTLTREKYIRHSKNLRRYLSIFAKQSI